MTTWQAATKTRALAERSVGFRREVSGKKMTSVRAAAPGAASRRPAVCVARAGFSPGRPCTGPECESLRVLRYPDGRERLIRYPLQSMNTGPAISGMPMVPDDFCIVEEEDYSMDATLVAGTMIDPQAMPSQEMEAVASGPGAASAVGGTEVAEVPMTAGEFLRWAQSNQQAEAREALLARAKESYEVLWELPFRYAGAGARELHVLVSYNEAGDQAELLTMRAANPKPSVLEEELNSMLQPKAGVEGKRIIVSDMRDAVLAFESPDEAARYCEALAAEEQWCAVDCTSVGSTDLFALTTGADALIVLFREESLAPPPHVLTACLKGGEESIFEGF